METHAHKQTPIKSIKGRSYNWSKAKARTVSIYSAKPTGLSRAAMNGNS